MAPARRSIRATVTKTQREPVARTSASRATKPALVAKIAEEAAKIIEDERAAQVSNTRVSRSKRRRQVPELVESEEPQYTAQSAIPMAKRGRRGSQQEIEKPATTKPSAVAQKS